MAKSPDFEPHPTQTRKQAEKLCEHLISAQEAVANQDKLPDSFTWKRKDISCGEDLSEYDSLPCLVKLARGSLYPQCPFSKNDGSKCPEQKNAEKQGLANTTKYEVVFTNFREN